MNNTRENLLLTALRLFARDGYEAVSVSQIAGELGMVKSSLYKHYKNKRDIFDSILARMEEHGREQVSRSAVSEGMAQASPAELLNYGETMFAYWTEDEFASLFRKLLTLEQFRSEEMAGLYQQYLCGGPVQHVAELLGGLGFTAIKAKQLALEFYAPMYLLYSRYDVSGESEREEWKESLHQYLLAFQKRIGAPGVSGVADVPRAVEAKKADKVSTPEKREKPAKTEKLVKTEAIGKLEKQEKQNLDADSGKSEKKKKDKGKKKKKEKGKKENS